MKSELNLGLTTDHAHFLMWMSIWIEQLQGDSEIEELAILEKLTEKTDAAPAEAVHGSCGISEKTPKKEIL